MKISVFPSTVMIYSEKDNRDCTLDWPLQLLAIELVLPGHLHGDYLLLIPFSQEFHMALYSTLPFASAVFPLHKLLFSNCFTWFSHRGFADDTQFVFPSLATQVNESICLSD